MIKNRKQVEKETKIFKLYWFGDMTLYKHDLEDALKKFCNHNNTTWAYAHCTNLEE